MFSGNVFEQNFSMFISIKFETWIYKFLTFFIFLKLVNHSCQQTIEQSKSMKKHDKHGSFLMQ